MNKLRKGTTWTTQVQNWLISNGWEITNRTQWMQPGDDLRATKNGRHLSIECKNHQRIDLAGWITQATKNAPHNHTPIVIAKRKGKTNVDDAYLITTPKALCE